MLRFQYIINEHHPEYQNDIYRFFGCLLIIVDNKVYYEENGVAVFEFFSAIKKWIASDYQIFEFTSVESDVSPDLKIFVNAHQNYQLYSAYQRFECNAFYSKEEICDALVNLKNEVGKKIAIPRMFDFCFAEGA